MGNTQAGLLSHSSRTQFSINSFLKSSIYMHAVLLDPEMIKKWEEQERKKEENKEKLKA
jgi:hypothetical protein